jgi:hypothetical protein
VSIQLRARLDRADLQEDLGVPVSVIPGSPDSGIKLDRSDQFLIPASVQRAEPRMREDGSAPVNHQGIIPRGRLGALRTTLIAAMGACGVCLPAGDLVSCAFCAADV